MVFANDEHDTLNDFELLYLHFKCNHSIHCLCCWYRHFLLAIYGLLKTHVTWHVIKLLLYDQEMTTTNLQTMFAVSKVRSTNNTEPQWPLSGVHSIMMVKSAHAALVRVKGARPPPFTLFPSQTKLWCTLQLRGHIHSSLFLLYPYMYSEVRSTLTISLAGVGKIF